MKQPTVFTFIAGNKKLYKRHKKLFWSYIKESQGSDEYMLKKARFQSFDTFCHLYFDKTVIIAGEQKSLFERSKNKQGEQLGVI